MDIEFKTKKLKKICEDPKIAKKELGINNSQKLIQRINEFKAAKTLDDIAKLSVLNGFHELRGNRQESFAVSLDRQFRLVFTSTPKKSPSNNISYIDIELIKIQEVIDYHGKKNKK